MPIEVITETYIICKGCGGKLGKGHEGIGVVIQGNVYSAYEYSETFRRGIIGDSNWLDNEQANISEVPINAYCFDCIHDLEKGRK